LFSGTSVKLWNSTTAVFAGDSTWLTGSQSGVNYRGTNGMANYGSPIPIYAPASFAVGSSIGHWDTGTVTGNPVMKHATPPATERRTYETFEIETLKDLGYTIVTVAAEASNWQYY
jgi:hypothetical protein